MQVLREVVLFLLFVCAKSQPQEQLKPRPETCDRPAEFMYRQCCVFPPFFTREIAKACGAVFSINFIDNKHNVTALSRKTLSIGCEHWQCVLNKYGFLTPENTLDDEKYFSHLDKWTELNPVFTTVITRAEVFCKNEFRMFMPLEVCDFYKIHGCIRNFVNIDCPAVISSTKCIEQKIFYDECREYFL